MNSLREIIQTTQKNSEKNKKIPINKNIHTRFVSTHYQSIKTSIKTIKTPYENEITTT